MFIFFPNLFSKEKCELLNRIALEHMEQKKLKYEEDRVHYKNSYGTGSIVEYEKTLHELTPLIKESTGASELKVENSYTRIYYNGATLNKHTDREGLDLTLSVCTFKNIDNSWPLYVEVKPGIVKSFETKSGDGALILGTKMPHWRDPLICENDQFVIQSFYHWRIIYANKIFL